MPHLSLRLLGTFEATLNSQPLSGFASDKVRALLIYLAMEADRSHSRSHLAGLLWPEWTEKQARTYLRHALTNLRKILRDKDAKAPFLLVTRQTLQFDRAAHHTIDALALTGTLSDQSALIDSQSLNQVKATELEDLLAQYHAPLLIGFAPKGCPDFEAWLLLKRERIQRDVLTGLHIIATYHESQHRYRSAIKAAQRIVELEPWHEEAHRQLMKLLASSGQRSAAIAQYEQCERLLKDELDVAPSDVTVALYRKILANTETAGTFPRATDNVANEPASASHRHNNASVNSPVPSQHQHNLPAPLTSLIGRTQELLAIQQLFQTSAVQTSAAQINAAHNSGVRLVTLTGAGGVGKTQLAIASGWALLSSRPDGVQWVALAAVQSPEQVVAAVAHSLGIRDVGGHSQLDQVKSNLADKRMLLILDNFEHLLEAAPHVSALLSACPNLHIMVTSRERLNLHGESEFVVNPLPIPSQIDGFERTSLSSNPAITLFCERAVAALHTFSPTPDNLSAIAEICRYLDGLPLAIELAAVRIKYMAPETLAGRLIENGGEAPRYLLSKMQDRPERHRSVWDTIDWSYSLLTEQEQAILRRVCIFVGGFTAEAAEATCLFGKQAKPSAVEEILYSLVDKSLLQLKRHTDGSIRFGLLEMVRQFGVEALAHEAELAAVEAAHAHYYATLAATLSPNTAWEYEIFVMTTIRREYPNLRTAFSWYHRQGDTAQCVKLSDYLHPYWNVADERDSLTCLSKTLALLEDEPPSPQYVETLASMGYYTRRFHGQLAARPYFERALSMNEATGNQANPKRIGMVYGLLAWMRFWHEANYAGADELFQLAQENDLATGDEWALAMTLLNRGNMAIQLTEFDKAEWLLEEAMARHQEIGDPWAKGFALMARGALYVYQQNYEHAMPLITEGLSSVESIQSESIASFSTYLFGLVAMGQSDFVRAELLLRRAIMAERGRARESNLVDRIIAWIQLSARVEHSTHALLTAGALDTNLLAAQYILSPFQKQRLDGAVEAARQQLSEDEVATAWARGEKMTLDETVALILESSLTSAVPIE